MGRNKVTRGVNDLETYCKQNGKEELLKEWHPTKNGNLKPSEIYYGSGNKVWWFLSYDDKETGKHFDFEWESTIANRVKGNCCPYLSGNQVYKGFNDLETLYPELAKEWHPTKNGNLKPSDVTSGSDIKVWWFLPYDDVNTGKHFDFEWEATIASRVSGVGCPFLSGKQIYKGFNDLKTLYPDIAKEWHPTKNDNLKPSDVTAGSQKKVWWYLSYDDVETGKHFDFEWESTIANRVQGKKCPYLSGQKVRKGYNDLESQYPELAKEWHPTKNGNLKPSDVTADSNKKVWWYLPYDDVNTGKHFDFEWQANISNRVKGNGCPYLCGYKAWKGYNDLKTLYPNIAKEWHPTKNGNLKPSEFTVGTHTKVWWLLPYDDKRTGKHFDFEWEAAIRDRVRGNDCPYINEVHEKVWWGYNDLETKYPEIAKEWHPTKNGNLKPSEVTVGTQRKVWWQGKCDHEWYSAINKRVIGRGCPYCSGSKTERLLYTYCKENEISFVAEKKFNEMSISFYPYDLYLYKSRLIIEADGIQHFQEIGYFEQNKPFRERVETDNIKNEYCLTHKIPILRIPYTYDVINDKPKIENIVNEFIKTRKVPQEILDFYKPYKESIGSNYYDVASKLNELE